jgi:sialate O-acetylesterase
VHDWRSVLGEVPFYYVQLPPYKYQGSTQNLAAQLREVQLQSLDSLNNVQMITTGDLGEEENIHPAKKKEIGQRLAYRSLWKTYGYNEMPFTNIAIPVCRLKTISGNKIILSFDNVDNGLVLQGTPSVSFEIAGSNGQYYPAEAQIVGNKLEVWSNNVMNPKQVRYAFKNYYQSVLFNNYMLPVTPFRTETLSEIPSSLITIKNNVPLVYPNPTTGKFSIKSNHHTEEKLVYNSTGRLMFRVYEADVDISDSPSGVYYLKTKDGAYKIIKF